MESPNMSMDIRQKCNQIVYKSWRAYQELTHVKPLLDTSITFVTQVYCLCGHVVYLNVLGLF